MDLQSAYELLPSPRYIRTLTIEPGGKRSDIFCNLKLINLDEQTEYMALSYTWGDGSLTAAIYCNNHSISVTQNLFAALHQFRDTKDSVSFWVDQLCINQADLEERSQQVRVMGEIYAKATKVWIWLGDEADDSTRGVAFMKRLGPLLEQTPQRLLTDKELSELGLDYAHAAAEWRAIIALYSRPWFGRLWVIQEAILATDLWVACGKEKFSWQLLVDATYFVWGRHSHPAELTDHVLETPYRANISRLHNIVDMRREVEVGWSLLEVLVFTREAQATDLRDKVYGLLGLTSYTGAEKNGHEQLARDIDVSYAKTVEQVYQDLAVLIVERYQGPRAAELLYAAGRVSLTHGLKLPSWVPDWSIDRQNVLWWNAQDSEYRAAKDTEARMYICGHQKSLLVVAGKEIDTIDILDAEEDVNRIQEMPSESYWAHLHALMTARESLLQKHSIFPSPDQGRDALWRTLTANRNATYQPASAAEVGSAFDNYRAGLDYLRQTGKIKREHQLGYQAFATLTERALRGRRFFVSVKGGIGLAPLPARRGDRVCVVLGGKVPVVLRPPHDDDGDDAWILLGECYFHGYMTGEAMDRGDIEVRDFVLK